MSRKIRSISFLYEQQKSINLWHLILSLKRQWSMLFLLFKKNNLKIYQLVKRVKNNKLSPMCLGIGIINVQNIRIG